MRYIGADKLIDDIRPFAEYDSNLSNKDWVRRFEIAIDAQPTADVVPMDYHERCLSVEIQKRMNMVEVVRCKDCKYGEVDNADFPNQYLCHHHGSAWNESNHYCSYGERADT